MPDNLAGCRLCLELPGETGLSLGATGKKSIIAALVLSVSSASHRKMCSNPYFGKQAIRSQQNISACQALPCLQSRQSLRSLAVNPIQLQCSTSDFLGWALAASYSCLSILRGFTGFQLPHTSRSLILAPLPALESLRAPGSLTCVQALSGTQPSR